MADSKKYNGSTWGHSLRKLGTATDTITTLPADLYADGNNATVGLVGNMSQSGTPTPANPVDVNGVGVKTSNHYNSAAQNTQNGFKDGYRLNQGNEDVSANNSITEYIPISAETKYTLKLKSSSGWASSIVYYDSSKNRLSYTNYENRTTISITTPQNAAYVRFTTVVSSSAQYGEDMLVDGETAPTSYIPYGYKIPISSADTTTPVYLGEVETTRKIKKLVLTGEESGWAKNDSLVASNAFYRTVSGYYRYSGLCTHYATVDSARATEGIFFGSSINFLTALSDNIDTIDKWKTYLQQQYAAGTPVTVWYVLENEETGIVNEPLRKIGDYADTVSGITIPTIAGADSFDVLTTLKPSEVSLKYTGWHDAKVKEWDGSDWQ